MCGILLASLGIVLAAPTHAYFVACYFHWIDPNPGVDAVLVGYGLSSAGVGLLIEEFGYAGMLAILADPWLVAFVAALGA
jgi:hypothetical protein